MAKRNRRSVGGGQLLVKARLVQLTISGKPPLIEVSLYPALTGSKPPTSWLRGIEEV